MWPWINSKQHDECCYQVCELPSVLLSLCVPLLQYIPSFPSSSVFQIRAKIIIRKLTSWPDTLSCWVIWEDPWALKNLPWPPKSESYLEHCILRSTSCLPFLHSLETLLSSRAVTSKSAPTPLLISSFIVHSTKLLNSDWSRAVQLIPK